MSEQVKSEKPLTTKQMQQQSSCWERWENWPAPIVRFLICSTPAAKAYWLGVPFNSIKKTLCTEQADGSCEMDIEWLDSATVQGVHVTGPKVEELYALFCLHVISSARADGNEIKSITTAIPKRVGFEGESDAKDITRVALLAPKDGDTQ
jgi:hypothetical protein